MASFDFDADALMLQIERARHHGVLPGTVLEVDWSNLPEEEVDNSPIGVLLGGLDRQLHLRATVRAIDRAASDDRVTGLVARVQPALGAMSVVQELRDAVKRFRAAGKATTAYAESLTSNAAYHLASAFERIVVLEAGTVWLTGVRAQAAFLGNALPNAGIEPEFLQRHEYKNMANQFMESDFTDAHREAVTALVDSVLGQRIADVATDRNLDETVVADAFATGPFLPADAIERGLIDAVGFRDEVWDDAKGDGHLLYLARYAHHAKPKKRDTKSAPTIAVVSVHGGISEGKSGFKPGLPPGKGTGSDTVVAGIRAAVDDDDVKAIILRVDSPGGSAIASEVIARAITVGREAGKPFVASMGSVAASGGYYVSAPCDRIVASPGTVTGSIGVVMGKFVTEPLRQRIKVSTKAIETSPNAGMLSSIEHFSEEHLEWWNASLDATYEQFLRRVAEGRNMSRDEVHAIAKGRVWSGADAHERGLVDVLGGFHEAVLEAKALAGIDADALVKLVDHPKSSPLDMLQKKENSEPAAAQLVAAVGAFAWRAAQEWERQLAREGVQARIDGSWIID